MTARKRIALVFRLNVTIALILTLVLVAGTALSVEEALTGHAGTSVTLGGLATADLLATCAFKPLAGISAAITACQRVEFIYLCLMHQLQTCAKQRVPEKHLCYRADMCNAIQPDITPMPASTPK